MTGTVYTALAAFQDAAPTVTKNRQGRGSNGEPYAYADLAAITDAARPALAEHGLLFVTSPGRDDHGNAYLLGVLHHMPSGSEVRGSFPLTGRHPQDIGSAITYGRRYLLATITGLVTEDDDDGAAASGASGIGDRIRAQAATPADTGTGLRDALTAALAAAQTVEDLTAVYADHALSTAPQDARDAFAERLNAVTAGQPDAEPADTGSDA